jgi:arginyl-tRNA synthetase
LEEYNLGVFVLLKSNGTSLYSTKDIALAYLKEEDYDFDLSLYVVATEQNHHFKQLFKTLELVGYDTSKLIHM